MLRIEGTFKGEIEVKRFYMPGVKATDTCEKCNLDVTTDYGSQYLPYPDVPDVKLHFYCPRCDHDWYREAVMEVTIRPREQT